ncbi:MAG: hypothetical protein KatS3mg104_1984 [Phycisphaerae bacterium]|nr:MAG: hypothetical protein KatS3mg104_1984 [Phycisphaerae bacterium]
MIRRQTLQGYELITQDDHAILAEDLARQVDAEFMHSPDPAEATFLGIRHHDAGWRLFDDLPVLSPAKIPLDVFEAPRHITHRAWLKSADKAVSVHPYAGLLVCLHGLSLSAMNVSSNSPVRFDPQQLRQQFELNKFQHQMIEKLESLRGQIGLRIDRPLRLGLADGWTDPEEEKLKHNFRFLQAMDVLSLWVCCTHLPSALSASLSRAPGQPLFRMNVHRLSAEELRLDPWIFRYDRVEARVPCRVIPSKTYSTEQELRQAYAQARTDLITVVIRPG